MELAAFDLTTLLQQSWNGLLNGGIYVLVAAGLSLVFGVMRVINMAHGEVTMLGGILIAVIMGDTGLGFWPGAALSVLATAVLGLALNRVAVLPLLRGEQLTVLISTIAVSFVLLHGATEIWGSFPRTIEPPLTGVVEVGGVFVFKPGLLLLGLGALTLLALYLFLARTRLGKMTRATGQNLAGARLIGIDTRAVYDATLVIASALAGLAGVLIMLISDITPSSGQQLLLVSFAVVIVAGMGNVAGAVVVGVALGVTEALFGQYISTYYRAAYIYCAMIAVLLLRPNGLFGRR